MDRTGTNAKPAGISPGRGLVALALATLLSSLGVSMANVALPVFTEVFAAPFAAVQWIVVAYLLASTTLIVGAGRLGDLVGQVQILRAGIGLFTLATVLCGLAPSLGALVAARAMQGAGGAVMLTAAMALVQATVAKDRMGRAMGLLGTMSAIGTALGPSLGGLILAVAGWRGLFLAVAPLGLLTFALTARTLPRGGREGAGGRGGFDLIGLLLIGVTLGSYALAVTAGERLTAVGVLLLLTLVIVSGAAFIWHERRTAAPLIGPGALRDPLFVTRLAMNALVATVMMATLVVGPFFLSRTLGLSAGEMGFVLAVGPVLSTISGVPAGRAVDRYGARICVNVGLVVVAVGAFALSVLPAILGLAGYIAAVAVMTPGYQLFLAANNTAVMTDLPADRRGLTSGLLNLSRNLGLITGASVMGSLFAFATGSGALASATAAEIATGQVVTFRVAGLLILAALLLSLTGDRLARRS